MAFLAGQKRGYLWEDAVTIHKFITNYHFTLNIKDEHHLESTFTGAIHQKNLNNKVISQLDKTTIVESIYCFGKKNRPDITVEKDGIAIELKYVKSSKDGFKNAIGQALLYRLKYKFVFLVLIIDKKNEKIYNDLIEGKEPELEKLVKHLYDELKVFTYIAPSFKLKPRTKKIYFYKQLEMNTKE